MMTSASVFCAAQDVHELQPPEHEVLYLLQHSANLGSQRVSRHFWPRCRCDHLEHRRSRLGRLADMMTVRLGV